MPYGITQCYLPPGRGDIPAFTPAEAGTRFSDSGGMQGWVDPGCWLEMVYPLNGHPSWTNQCQCWLTSLMQSTMLTTTPSRHLYVYVYVSVCVLNRRRWRWQFWGRHWWTTIKWSVSVSLYLPVPSQSFTLLSRDALIRHWYPTIGWLSADTD